MIKKWLWLCLGRPLKKGGFKTRYGWAHMILPGVACVPSPPNLERGWDFKRRGGSCSQECYRRSIKANKPLDRFAAKVLGCELKGKLLALSEGNWNIEREAKQRKHTHTLNFALECLGHFCYKTWERRQTIAKTLLLTSLMLTSVFWPSTLPNLRGEFCLQIWRWRLWECPLCRFMAQNDK